MAVKASSAAPARKAMEHKTGSAMDPWRLTDDTVSAINPKAKPCTRHVTA